MEQSSRFQHDLFGILTNGISNLGEYGVGVRMLPNNCWFQKSWEEGIIFFCVGGDCQARSFATVGPGRKIACHNAIDVGQALMAVRMMATIAILIFRMRS